MAEILRSPNFDWFEKAWLVSDTLVNVAEVVDSDHVRASICVALQPDVEAALKKLQTEIGLELCYRIHVVHKVKIQIASSKKVHQYVLLDGTESPGTAETLFEVIETNAGTLSNAARSAFVSYIMLEQLIADGCISNERRRTLPLWVAMIGIKPSKADGPPTKRPNANRASALTLEIRKVVGHHPEETANWILDDLIQSGDVVKELRDSKVSYFEGDKLVTVSLDRFEAIVSEAKKRKKAPK